MLKIKLKPSGKSLGFYTFHNGFEWVKFTNFRKYSKSLLVHEKFLNRVIKHKHYLLFECLLENDLEGIEEIIIDLKRAKILNRNNPTDTKRLNLILMNLKE